MGEIDSYSLRDLEDLNLFSLSIKIIATCADLHQRINTLRALSVDDELDAMIRLATGHRAKALEWGFVILCDEFSAGPLSTDNDPVQRDDELSWLYVAVTRAMRVGR